MPEEVPDYSIGDVELNLGTFWTVDDGNWKLASGSVRTKITPGTYQLVVHRSFSGTEIMLREMVCRTDRLSQIPGSLAQKIGREVETFWRSRRRYELMGTLHKRGLMLEGIPGTGKTAICLIVGQEVAKHGGISVFTMPGTFINPLPGVLHSIREVQPDMPIVNIIEDIDTHRGEMDTLLPMFDGEMQVNNILHLATTNYIDKLDARLTNRPSRFDKVFKVGPPTKRARRAYFTHLLERPMAEADEKFRFPADKIEEMVAESKGLPFAHMKEMAHAIYINGETPKAAGSRLRGQAAQLEPSSGGFNRDADEDDEDCDCPDCSGT